jgi:hypothetical protein
VSAALPPESERLLAVAPNDFVAERDQLTATLREEGRSEEAAAVAALGKPSVVVLAVNRAARDRPKAARAAAQAGEQVEKAQMSADPEAFRDAVRGLDDALDLLGEVAVAHVSPGKRATDAMRRRVHDLLRRAVADADTRDALARGVLLEEQEAAGFTSFAGLVPTKRTRAAPSRATKREEERRQREQALRDELTAAEDALSAAEEAVRAADRERAKAERTVASIRAKLDRLT